MGRGPWLWPVFCGLVIIILWAPRWVEATEGDAASWTISVLGGLERVGSRDELGSPLAYRGSGFPLVLMARYEGEGWAVVLEGGGFYSGVNGGRLQTSEARFSGHWAETAVVDLAARMERGIIVDESHELRLGAAVSHWTFYRSYHYDPAQIGAVETWDAPVTLEVSAELRRRLGKRLEVGLMAAVPLAGWVIRPNYSVRGDERVEAVENRLLVLSEGSFASWGRLQMFSGRGQLRWVLTQRVAVIGHYRMGLMAFRGDVLTRAIRHRGTVGLSLTF